MIRGLPASIMLHVAVIGAGYIAWPYVATTVTEDEFVVVPVELGDVGEMTNVAPVIERVELLSQNDFDVIVSATATDADGDDLGEQIFVDQALAGGGNNLTAAIPSGATVGSTFARFRVTGTAGYSYFGLAPKEKSKITQ